MEHTEGESYTPHELQRMKVIEDSVAGRITVREAARLLQLSPRQIKRLKQKCRVGETDWMRHGNRGRPKPWRTPDAVRTRIIELWRDRYSGLNDSQLWRELTGEGRNRDQPGNRAAHPAPGGPRLSPRSGRPRRDLIGTAI